MPEQEIMTLDEVIKIITPNKSTLPPQVIAKIQELIDAGELKKVQNIQNPNTQE